MTDRLPAPGASTRPDEERLWHAVVEALRDVIEPALPRGHAWATAHQLQGLARYALARGADPTPGRTAEIAALTGSPTGASWAEVATRASELLIAARSGRTGARTDRIRAALADQLRAEVEVTAPLLETFARHGQATSGEVPSVATEGPALEPWLSARVGEAFSSFSAHVMSGGHSRRMLDVRAETGTQSLAFVVRVEQGGVFGTDGASEARIMTALGGAGVPVAPVLWIEPSTQPLGHPFFVMPRVAGTDDPDEAALGDFMRRLDALHRLPVDAVAAGFPTRPARPADGVRAGIDRWESVYRSSAVAPIPLLDDAAAWLRLHLRPTGPVAVVHGDPGPGNFLHLGGRVTAITDWEFGHLGDPAEDWVYLAELRGARLMDHDEWVAVLAEHVDVRYDDAAWRAWTVFNLFKGACANITALDVFSHGPSPRPDLLAVGTAVHLRFLERLTTLIDG